MKYSHLITKGIEQNLDSVAFHHAAPLTRYVMLQKDTVSGDGGFRTAVHVIDEITQEVQPYCDMHWHDFDEVNLILSNDGQLTYKVTLEDEMYIVHAPATVYIPKGIKHAAEVISGKGMYIAITFTKDYIAKG